MGSEWTTYSLEDCLSAIIDYRGKTPVKTDSGVPLITAKIVKSGRIERPTEFISEANYSIWMKRGFPEVGDVVLTTEAPLGEVGQIRKLPVGLAQRIVTLRGKERLLDNGYLLYALQSEQMQARLRDRSSGTTVLGIKQSELRKIEIELPPFEYQKDVAGILSNLDDRIDNLRQTNTTLEAIAQALFKSWFVDFDPVHAKAEGREPEAMDAATAAFFPSEFEESELGPIPKSWHAGRLGDISINHRDQAKPDKIDPNTPYFGLEHMPRKSIALGNHGTADGLGSSKFWFDESDILFGKLRPYFHKVGLAPFKGICSTDILVMRPLKPAFHAFLLTHASSDAIIAYATRLSNGAKMPRSSWKDIASYPICIPTDSIAQTFNDSVEPIFERIKENVRTSSTLSELRDTLLPRLISGKLRLPEALEDALV